MKTALLFLVALAVAAEPGEGLGGGWGSGEPGPGSLEWLPSRHGEPWICRD